MNQLANIANSPNIRSIKTNDELLKDWRGRRAQIDRDLMGHQHETFANSADQITDWSNRLLEKIPVETSMMFMADSAARVSAVMKKQAVKNN